MTTAVSTASRLESGYAWVRLVAALLIGTIGGVGMWSVAVALPAVQAEFGAARGAASLPYTLTMLGLAIGGIAMGRLADRRGVTTPLVIAAIMLGVGFWVASEARSLWQFVLAQGLLIGALGTSATFAPLVADISLWFNRRRGVAVALVASGNYAAGAIWPPILQWAIEGWGWRTTYFGIGLVCTATILPLTLAFRRAPPQQADADGMASAGPRADFSRPLGLAPNTLLALLMIAGVACCVGMSMPQVHIVAYCGDLGLGLKAGAEMLSLMFGAGVVSRLASGWISDKIGGLATLLIGSTLQTTMLVFFLPYTGLSALYIISALFGFVQGGIVPSYAIIVREFYPPQQAGTRVAVVLMSTIVGMAIGGWVSGVIFDYTGSYRAAFLHGIAWNLLNVAIASFLILRRGRSPRLLGAAA